MHDKSPLPDLWNVPREFRDRLGDRVGRQRAMLAEGHLLLVLHAPPVLDQPHRDPRLFWRSPDGTWQSNNLGPGIKALEKHLAEYAEAIEKLDEAEERAHRADDYFGIIRRVAPLRRSARNLHTTLHEARQMVPDDRGILVCRDRSYVIERSAELLQSDTQTGLDCAMARRAEEQTEHSCRVALASHRLNRMAALFLPVATIGSIFGMNLRHGLEVEHSPWVFWMIAAAGVCLGVLLKSSISGNPIRQPSGPRPGRIE